MAKASKAIRGAMFGSVPMPVRTPPSAIPVTQYTAWSATPTTRNGRTRRLSHGPTATANDTMASTHGRAEPLCGSAFASEVSTCAYHDGCPLDAVTSVELIDPPARLAGKSQSTAESAQKADQATRGAPAPSGPVAAAEDGIPGSTSRAGASLGQTSSPINGYRMTAPGAPVNGDAVPVSSMPKPSPNHQTPKAHTAMATMAGFTVRRNSMPTPMHS